MGCRFVFSVNEKGMESMGGDTQHIIGRNVIIIAQRHKVTDGQAVNAVFVTGIHLLGGSQNAGNISLL